MGAWGVELPVPGLWTAYPHPHHTQTPIYTGGAGLRLRWGWDGGAESPGASLGGARDVGPRLSSWFIFLWPLIESHCSFPLLQLLLGCHSYHLFL